MILPFFLIEILPTLTLRIIRFLFSFMLYCILSSKHRQIKENIMPNYQTHLAGGSIAFALALVCIVPYMHPSPLTAGEWLLFALAGSLFPDIDIKSKGQKYFYWMIFILLCILTYTQRFIPLAMISILAMIPMLTKHRGLFHRAWFIIGAPMLLWYTMSVQYPPITRPLFYDICFFISGALSHLWLDMGLRKMIRM